MGAALAEVPVSLRELFATSDEDYLAFVTAVVGMTVEVRADMNRRGGK